MNYLASHGQLLGKPTVADEFIWNMPEGDSDNAQSLYGRALDVVERRRAGRRNIWEALVWGKTGVVLFSLHPSSGWGYHMIGGGDPPRLSAMSASALAMRATAEKVRQVTADTRVMFAPVALLETLDATYMSRPAEVPLHEARALNYFAAMRHLPLFYLSERSLAAEQASLDQFKVIIAPYC